MSTRATALDGFSTSEMSYGKLGTWLFLASEIMLFGALFSSLILLRTGADSWPHGYALLNVKLATLNTAFLITSSVTMVLSYVYIQSGESGKYKLFMWFTILLGSAFLVVKYFEYTHKFHLGIYPKSNNFYATYFTMTGLHVVHVIAGLIVNAYMALPGLKLYKTNPKQFVSRIECCGLYWHFVDLVWIFLFPTLYLL